MASLLSETEEFSVSRGLIKPGDRILACVSGGADSMCLLDALIRLSDKLGFTVAAAHFNHLLRGDESDLDERFVMEYCEKRGVRCFCSSGDVAGEARRLGRGVEDTARLLRYRFFAEISEKYGFTSIATAHTADDNLETVIMRLARGAGPRGLAGIPPRRGNIIRPLLSVTRADVMRHNGEYGVPHREDSSNSDDVYSRNRVRLHIVPVLRELDPMAARRVSDTSELLRLDDEYLCGLADDFIRRFGDGAAVDARELSALPYPVASRVVRRLSGAELGKAHVDAALRLAENGGPSAQLDLPGGVVRREYGRLCFSAPEAASFAPFTLDIGESVESAELGLIFSVGMPEEAREIYKSFTTFLFKFDSLCGKLTVRPRETGDTIRLSERSGSKSLKRLFIEKRIPRHKRGAIPVICDEAGPVAIPWIGRDTRVAAAPGDRVIKLTVEEIKKL